MHTSSLAALGFAGLNRRSAWGADLSMSSPLAEFGYGDVSIASEVHESQLRKTHAVLMALSEDSLLKPFRQMSGMPAPGEDLGGWYTYDPAYDYRKHIRYGIRSGMPHLDNGCRPWRGHMQLRAKRKHVQK